MPVARDAWGPAASSAAEAALVDGATQPRAEALQRLVPAAPLDPEIRDRARKTLEFNWRGAYAAPSVRRPSSWLNPLDPKDGFRRSDPGTSAKYPWQWLWDSGFHTTVWTDFGELEKAKSEFASLLSMQRSDGFIPNMSGHFHGLEVQITQSPVLAQAAVRLQRQGALPEGAYERLAAYHEWVHSKADSDGLYAVRNGLESGNDTSPVFDRAHWGDKKGNRVERWLYTASRAVHDFYGVFAPKGLPRPSMKVKSVLFNAIYARDLEAMAELATSLGRDADAARYRARYEQVKQSMRTSMADPQAAHLMWSLNRHGDPLQVKTHELFVPLYAGLLTQDEAKALVGFLTDPKNGFWTKFPVPSTATDEGAFNPKDYWRGPTWINLNYLIVEGLLRYGFHREAKEIYERTLELFRLNPGPMGFNEGYDPNTGQAVRQGQFGWSTLIVSMEARLREYERQHSIG